MWKPTTHTQLSPEVYTTICKSMKDQYAGVALSQLPRTFRHDLTTRKMPPQDPHFPRRRRETLLSRITKHNPSWWAITGFEDLGPRGVPRGNQVRT